jgi:hypothetical protein
MLDVSVSISVFFQDEIKILTSFSFAKNKNNSYKKNIQRGCVTGAFIHTQEICVYIYFKEIFISDDKF